MEDKYKKQQKEIIAELKEDIQATLHKGFVEDFESWREKMKIVNNLIKQASFPEDCSLYKYDDFCKKILEISKDVLENKINYIKLFVSEKEFKSIMEDKDFNEQEREEILKNILHEKFVINVSNVLEKNFLTESVKYKTGERFYLIEESLDVSIAAAAKMLNINLSEA